MMCCRGWEWKPECLSILHAWTHNPAWQLLYLQKLACLHQNWTSKVQQLFVRPSLKLLQVIRFGARQGTDAAHLDFVQWQSQRTITKLSCNAKLLHSSPCLFHRPLQVGDAACHCLIITGHPSVHFQAVYVEGITWDCLAQALCSLTSCRLAHSCGMEWQARH